MPENTNNYSDEWQPYTGDYDKFEYDILLKDGREIRCCYPNAGVFQSFSEEHYHQKFEESEIEHIKFAEVRRLIQGNSYSNYPFGGYVEKFQEISTTIEENPYLKDYFKERIPKGMVVGVRTEPKKTRNAVCECGSGRKYKKCCQ